MLEMPTQPAPRIQSAPFSLRQWRPQASWRAQFEQTHAPDRTERSTPRVHCRPVTAQSRRAAKNIPALFLAAVLLTYARRPFPLVMVPVLGILT